MPTSMSTSPIAALVQNTVERSSSTIVRRWMSAVPSALSVKTTTKPEKTSTIAASPQSSGASSRARISATTMRETWSVSCDPAFQATPLRIRDADRVRHAPPATLLGGTSGTALNVAASRQRRPRTGQPGSALGD